MERKVWEKIVGFVEVEKYPALPCPYCKTKSLHLDKASISYRKAICSGTTALIEEAHKQKMGVVTEAFNANVLLGVLVGFGAIASTIPREPAKFICFFKCQSCDMDVSATGTSQYAENRNKYSQKISPLIKVEYFTPPLPIFNVDSLVPATVKKELLQAFNHYHSDLCSSGTKLRRSIEKLCHELGFQEKNLHCSLSSLEKAHPREGRLLNSLKLLGNEAVHSDMVNEEDLLDAFEVQEFVLGIFERIREENKIQEKANKLLLKYDKQSNN